MPYLLTTIAAAIFLILLWVHAVSRQERERTAARRALVAALFLPLPYLFVAWVSIPAARSPTLKACWLN